MAELLFEIFSEEVPARMQADASADLKRMLTEALDAEKLTYDKVYPFISSRRMGIMVDGLETAQKDISEERKGPAVSANEKAIEGFLKSTGLTLAQLEKRETPKGEFYFATINKKGRPTAEVIAEKLSTILRSFPWPKPMRWAHEKEVWIRPIHSIICMFDGKVVPLTFTSVTSGDFTYGHRFLSPQKLTVKNFKDYEQQLRTGKVIIDADERKKLIAEQCQKIAAEKKLVLKEDKGLLEEVCGLCEWPVAMVGDIDKSFMHVPKEVLISSMRNHQKYFSLLNQDGSLAPHFIVMADMEITDRNRHNIKTGNEKVLRARLSDAKFFWENDCEVKLETRVAALKDRVFHAQIGSMQEKVERITKLAGKIAGIIGADAKLAERAALLAKADLSSGMVGEFPELQGIMGKYYALHDKENAEVANAVAEHYSPLGPNDSCPKNPVSVCVALADKIDTLVGFWMINEKPTGSRDPFGLRRAALGVIRTVLENDLHVHLKKLFTDAKSLYANLKGEIEDDLLEFFAERLKIHLKGNDIRHDYISAVFAHGRDDDFALLLAKIGALREFLDSDDGKNLLVAHKRSANILRIEQDKDKQKYNTDVDASLFENSFESELYSAIQEISKKAADEVAKNNFKNAMIVLANLRKFVDNFFSNVTVNCSDARMRVNRLKMLGLIVDTNNIIANFSLIES